jgi:predicted nucleic acid-binding protein
MKAAAYIVHLPSAVEFSWLDDLEIDSWRLQKDKKKKKLNKKDLLLLQICEAYDIGSIFPCCKFRTLVLQIGISPRKII